MSGISRLTALEIFTNPGDLEITIRQENGDGKFAIGIYRGPGHSFKPMITSQPFADTSEEAIKAIEGILQAVHESIAKEFENREIDKSKILDQSLIGRIIEELRLHQKACTYKMLAIAD